MKADMAKDIHVWRFQRRHTFRQESRHGKGHAWCVNPLSATWRIYPSSKWSSQWPYDGYIRHGWMTSCGRGRDSATLECFGRGYRGTIFVRSSKLSLFFPELCPFRSFFFFLFPALLKDLAPNVQAPGLLVSTMFWGSFWKLRSVTGHFFLRTLTTITSISWNFLSFFPKQSRCYLPDSYSDPKSEQSTLVMVRWKLEWKLDFRALARSSAEGPSIVVAIGTSRVRWSMVQKRKKNKEVSVWMCEGSTLHHRQTSEFWGACFRDPTSLPFRTSLFSWMSMYNCRTVRL